MENCRCWEERSGPFPRMDEGSGLGPSHLMSYSREPDQDFMNPNSTAVPSPAV